MKKLVLACLILVSFIVIDVHAQRTIGNSREGNEERADSRNPLGRSNKGVTAKTPVSSRPSQETQGRPPVHPHPPVSVGGPVCVILPPPAAVIHVENVPAPSDEPELFETLLKDKHAGPARSGFDFSDEEVVPYDYLSADVHFERGGEGPEFIVGVDTDIQDLGQVDLFFEFDALPMSNWSPMHRVHAEVENVYLLWTWDNQYYIFRVLSISEARLSIEWTKVDGGSRIASNISYRNGEVRRNPNVAMFGK